MKKLLRLKTMLLLCALIAGSGSVWADSSVVDFESALSTYSDWEFTALNNSGTAVTAHGGDKYASTSAGEAYAKTKNKIETPNSLVCYYTKCSSNTNTNSSFKIQVSTDGSKWTDVVEGNKMNSVTQGTWYKLEADLSSYSDVYIRVYYKGTTAIRGLDDITLAYTIAAGDDPVATLSKTSLNFGSVNIGTTKELTFTVTPANLEGDLSILCDNDKYEVSPTSIAKTVTEATTISVTAKPTAYNDDMDGVITVSGGGITNVTVVLTTTPFDPSRVITYELLKDASTLRTGDQFIIAYDGTSSKKALGNIDSGGKFYTGTDVTIEEDKIFVAGGEEFAILTLEGTNSGWNIKSSIDNNYFNLPSSSNELRQTETPTSKTSQWTISINSTSGVATISNVNTTTRAIKWNAGSPRFACYTSGQQDIKIYRRVYEEVIITSAEYATYSGTNALDFSSTGIKAYTATDNKTSVTLNEITSGKVPANTPVVLYKEGLSETTTFNVPVIASAEAVGDNDLQVSTGTDVENMYVLAMNPTIGFYPWAGDSDLSAGKVYLQGKASYGARAFIGFDGNETTGITSTAMQPSTEPYYDLQGRRVAQPTKGLYIVNRRKVVIK